jgi:acyl-coenzyme A synthetase/AMP-(fatty) acid ligase
LQIENVSDSDRKNSIVSALCDAVERRPEQTAVTELQVGSSSQVTYRDLEGLVRAATKAIASSARDVPIVPIFMQRSILSVAVGLAALSLGKRFAFLTPRLKVPQLRSALASLGEPALIADGAALMGLRPAALAPEALRDVSILQLSIGSLTKAQDKQAVRLNELCGAFAVRDLTRSGPAGPLELAAAAGAGCCLFTSGSTGEAKGVLISGQDLYERAYHEVEAFGITRADRLLNLLPFSFDVGLNQILSSIVAGAELVIAPSWLPGDIHRTIRDFEVTGVSGVPAIWADYLGADLALGAASDHPHLRYLTVSGGSLSPERFAALQASASGVAVIKTYGQTEAFRTTALLPAHPVEKHGSVGTPFGDVHVLVVNDDLTPCRPGEKGEVVHAGLGVMEGYLQGPVAGKLIDLDVGVAGNATKKAIRTGDMGHLDDDGFLYLSGRRDAMVKIHGNRVYPEEVTARIHAMAGILDAEVVTSPVSSAGDDVSLTAFVVGDAESTQDPMRFRRELAASLPAYMVPADVRFLGELPRTATGKPDKQRLKKMITDETLVR